MSLAAWVGLLLFRGGFWRADQHLGDDTARTGTDTWPTVAAVIPARDEAPTIGRVVTALLVQDYGKKIPLVLVDDSSTDGTVEAARAAAEGFDRLTVIEGRSLKPGWTGKLWAVAQGLEHIGRVALATTYVLFLDADIQCDPGVIGRLVAKAESENLDLVSVMAALHCQSARERFLIPAFVFFFQKLYPYPWVNDPNRRHAAGG